MKTGWRQYATRKDKLETIAGKGMGLQGIDAAAAWERLMERMEEMSSPESPRLPRFNDLLLAIVAGIARGRNQNRSLTKGTKELRNEDFD